MNEKMSMVPLLVQSRDVPARVRADLRMFLDDPARQDAGCHAALGLMTSFDLSRTEVMDLMGFEASACACA